MERKCFLWLLSVLFPLILFGKKDFVYTKPISLYSNAEKLHIEKVVFSDTATVVCCSYTGKMGSWILLSPTTILSDERALEYPVRNTCGIVLGEKLYVSQNGNVKFQLCFAPLPEHTRIFDLIEGTDKNAFRIYGIHDENSRITIPVAKENTDMKETSNFIPGGKKTVVRGNIAGYSRDKGYGIVFFQYRTMEDHSGNTAPCAYIRPDGTFQTELLLEHSLWGTLSTGGNRPHIPFYIRPGDTLDITVKGLDENKMTLEYATTHSDGCYPRMLKHEVPVIYSGWEDLQGGLSVAGKDAFINTTKNFLEKNDKLCNYIAWKYGFSPWETHLIKNRYRCAVVFNHTVWADALLGKNMGRSDVDGTGSGDDSLYKIWNEIPLDDASLSFLPFFPDLIYRMGLSVPFTSAERDAAVSSQGNLQMMCKADSLQVAAFREITGMEEMPWTFQCCLIDKINRLSVNNVYHDVRKDVVDDIASYLTYPYLKHKMIELDSICVRHDIPVGELPELVGHNVLSSILTGYKGQYVQMVCFSSPQSDSNFCLSPCVENLCVDFNGDSNLQMVFVFNGYAYSEDQFNDFIGKLPEGVCTVRLDFEDYLELQKVFRFSESRKQITFDRNGWVFRTPFDMNNESAFRQRLRHILDGEKRVANLKKCDALDWADISVEETIALVIGM